MKKLACIVFCVSIFASLGFTKTKEPAAKVWSGYLSDKMCSKRNIGNPDKLAKHSKTCMTDEACAASGYGLIVGKKFIPFDAEGNNMAAKFLNGTTRDKDFQVTATGSMKKNKLAISDLKEK